MHELETVLEVGPAAWGWEDQCWTLGRIAEVVRRWFKVDYSLARLNLLLHRIGWSVQVPARRDEAQVARWREETWPVVKGRRRSLAQIIELLPNCPDSAVYCCHGDCEVIF